MLHTLAQRRPNTPLWRLALYEVGRVFTAVLATLLYRYRAYGSHRVPRTGPILLVANHQSYLDPPVVGLAVHNRQLDYVARFGLFHSPWFSRLISLFNALPIREDTGDSAAIRDILRRLGDGHAVLIFPEGSRTEDGAMQPFKRGVAVLVKRARCPVVPVAIEGCFDAWPRRRRWPRVWNVRIAAAVGRPLAHEELLADGPDAAMARLEREIDQMRLALRRRLRRESRGLFPAPGPADGPAAQSQSAQSVDEGQEGGLKHPGTAAA